MSPRTRTILLRFVSPLALVVIIAAVYLVYDYRSGFQPVYIDKAGERVPDPSYTFDESFLDNLRKSFDVRGVSFEEVERQFDEHGRSALLNRFVDGDAAPLDPFEQGPIPWNIGNFVVYVDGQGNEVFQVDGFAYEGRPFSEGFAAVATQQNTRQFQVASGILLQDTKDLPVTLYSGWGFVDDSGTFRIEPNFRRAFSFSEGLAAVQTDDNKWGFIDTNGEFKIAPQFDGALSFSEGLAPVNRHGGWGYIDKDGTTIIPTRFRHALPFSHGLAAIAQEVEFDGDNGALSGPVNLYPERYGYIDKTGEIVIPCQFGYARPFREGLAAVQLGDPSVGRWGYIDTAGSFVIKPRWGYAMSFEDGIAMVFRRGISHEFYTRAALAIRRLQQLT